MLKGSLDGEKSDIFKKVFQVLRPVVEDNICLECDGDGIECQAMDQAHVALADIFLDKVAFSNWECESAMKLGLSVPRLVSIFNLSDARDSLEITAEAAANDDLDVKEPNTVQFKFSNEGYTCDFNVATIEEEAGSLALPKKDYKNEFSLPTTDFQKIVRDMTIIGTSLEIDVNKNGVVFSCDSDGRKGTMSMSETADQSNGVRIRCREAMKEEFALHYLQSFCRVALTKTVNIKMSPGLPLQVEYDLAEFGHVRFYCAPKNNE